MKKFEIFFGMIKIPLDFAMTILGFLAAYKLRLITEPSESLIKPIDYSALPTIHEYLNFSIWMALALVVIFAISKMYYLKSTHHLNKELTKSVILCAIWAMFIISYFFFTRQFPFSRLAMIYSWMFTAIFIICGKSFIRVVENFLLKQGMGKRKLVFLGNNKITQEIHKALIHNPGYTIVGTISENKESAPVKHLGTLSKIKHLIHQYHIDEIIQTTEASENLLELCDLNHISYRFIPNQVEMRQTNIEIDEISGIPVISLRHTPLDGWGKVAKRILDIIGSGLGLILLSPIFLITAIAIKLDSKGPILFTKLDNGKSVRRVGQYGKLFKFYKFRSMHPNTDSLRYNELAKDNTRTEGPLVKIKQDPRVTRVGRFIRKYSIDELPQLWSVFTGKLSLVGPRPHLPEEVKQYRNHQKFVLTIKPGITGIPQTSGRSNLSFDDEVKLDRYYIENWSIWLDIKIILKTFAVVIKGHDE
ncbi:sugar transferase [Patescibacteria group bacterium]|nr:sugar transferase [Patescibacteria group bacterium]